MFDDSSIPTVSPPERDGVAGLVESRDARPTIVSVSDVHGYLSSARSALLTLADHPEFDPVVTADPARRLQWAGGEEYVLVFNGDLFDRGPHNEAVGEMVARLQRQAPDGHVRVTLGNHEMGVLMPDRFGWSGWYSTARSDDERRAFVDRIMDGLVVAAYEGYKVTYAHAGQPEPYEASRVNEAFVEAADRLREAIGTDEEYAVQERLIECYSRVFGLGGRTGRGRGAGLAWLDFEFMPSDAPPQVVGHTRQDSVRREGTVICQNTIRENNLSDGGEAVVVERPEELLALERTAEGGVDVREFTMPDVVEVPPQ